VLVSFGKTNSVITTWLSAALFVSMQNFYKDTGKKVQGTRCRAQAAAAKTQIL
jgi:hypothetical protein